jgi:hypothetical protein
MMREEWRGKRPHRKLHRHWWICAITPDGKRANLAGWEDVKFQSYSKCLEAIEFIETVGGSPQAWRALRRDA